MVEALESTKVNVILALELMSFSHLMRESKKKGNFMNDLEADFWKEHFVHLLHKNMIRTNAEILKFEDVKSVFEKFSLYHPEYKVDFKIENSYATWEVFVTQTVKLRLFIQNQIKASLLQKKGVDFVKIADAKFPYNPFYEIAEFLSHKDEFLVELTKLKEKSAHQNRKIKIAIEFIEANLQEKYKNSPNIIWNLSKTETDDNKIKLTLQKDKKTQEYFLSPEKFVEELPQITQIDAEKIATRIRFC